MDALTAKSTPKYEILSTFNTRKYGYCSDEIHRNFIFLYNRDPSKAANAETSLVKDLVDTMVTRYNKETLALELPKALESLKGPDTK